MRDIILLDDTHLYLHDAGELLSDHIVRENDYFESDLLHYMADKYPQQDVILDIGANIGNHTVHFAQYLEYSTIIAFEPVQENLELLRLNTRHYPNIVIRNEAVGAFRGKVALSLNNTNMGACEVTTDTKDANLLGRRIIEQVRVDDLLLIPRVTLMKIDVEWYEPEVLKGAQAILSEDKPLILIEDIHGDYGKLLPPEYELFQAWIAHRTYLYGVPNESS